MEVFATESERQCFQMQSEPKTGSKTLHQSKGEQKREHHEIEGIGSKTEQKQRKEGPAMPLYI